MWESSASAWAAVWRLVLAAHRPDAVKAAAPYYGVIPWASAQPDWSKIEAKIVGEYGEKDGSAGPDAVRALEAQLRGLGKDATLHIHPDADHAFFNDTRPEVYDAGESSIAFARTVELFRSTLDFGRADRSVIAWAHGGVQA